MSDYKRGVVEEVDAHRVRVRFPDRSDDVSPWLDVLTWSTHQDKAFRVPRRGNQVACLINSSGTEGVVLGAVFSAVDTPPEGASEDVQVFDFLGGLNLKLKSDTGRLELTVPGGLDVVGDVHFEGTHAVRGGGAPGANANKVDERLDALEEHAASHTHTGVTPGPGATGTALPPLSPGASVAFEDFTSD